MTDDEMRIVIAEKCGWEKVHINSTIGVCGYEPNTPKLSWTCVPDYPNDLNAMHEAEKILKTHQQRTYSEYLCKGLDGLRSQIVALYHATARQRAEAFIKTVCPEKWKGNE